MAAIAIAWNCGCAHAHREHARNGRAGILPEVTAIITGPAALLLTNAVGFQAEYNLSIDGDLNSAANAAGQFLTRGAEVRLTLGTAKSGTGAASGFIIVWDAAARRGFVLSEALQGYAPIGGSDCFSNLLMEETGSAPQRLDGHVVEKVNATITGCNGQAQAFELSRSGNLPMEIHSSNAAPNFTLRFSKIEVAAPSGELFLLPKDFTKYDSEESLLAELASRQQDFQGGGHGAGAGDYSGKGGRHHDRNGPDDND